MTKYFTNMAAQGDLLIRKIKDLPVNLKLDQKDHAGRYVVAHSETGHSHVIDGKSARLLIDETNQFIAYLKVSKPCEIEHLRSFDTHEALHVEPGIYEIRRQVEYVPGGLRRVQD